MLPYTDMEDPLILRNFRRLVLGCMERSIFAKINNIENAENPPQAGFVWKKRREGGESIYDFPRDDKKQLTLRYDFYELK